MKQKIELGTIIRTVVLVLALINQGLTISGKSVLPISDEDVSNTITFVFTMGSALAAWWKNNSFTQNAIEADAVLKDVKGGK